MREYRQRSKARFVFLKWLFPFGHVSFLFPKYQRLILRMKYPVVSGSGELIFWFGANEWNRAELCMIASIKLHSSLSQRHEMSSYSSSLTVI